MFELRPYQAEAISKARERIAQGHRPIICAPTGSGKTVIAGHIARDAIDDGKRVLFMSGREEILKQVFATFNEICGRGKVGFLMRDQGPWWFYPPVTVASWDTLKARWGKADTWKIPADVVLVDECHLALSEKMTRTIMPYYEDRTVIGFTATPARKSGRGLGSYFTRIIQVRSVQQIIDDGFLAPCEYWAGSHADLSKVRTDYKTNDYQERELSRASMEGKLIGDILDNWLRLAKDRHTIVFAVDIAHAQAVTERFQAAGVAAEVIHSKMNQHTRAELTEQFRTQRFQVLVNVGIATYGYDVPSVSCIVLARPTKSIVLHLQMIGRGMRPKSDGGFCMVLDHADNVRRLGCAEDEIRWRLDDGKGAAVNTTREGDPSRNKQAEAPPTTCESCGHMFSRSRICPKCGWEKPVMARDIETVDADLVKIRKSRKELELESIDRRRWYLMARGWCEQHGKKRGMAYYRYREKFGEDPPTAWNRMLSLEPDARVSAYMRAGLIRYAKSKRHQQAAEAAA